MEKFESFLHEKRINEAFDYLNSKLDFESETIVECFNIDDSLLEDYASDMMAAVDWYSSDPNSIGKRFTSMGAPSGLTTGSLVGAKVGAGFAYRYAFGNALNKTLMAKFLEMGVSPTLAKVLSISGAYIIPGIALSYLVGKGFNWIKNLITKYRLKPYKKYLDAGDLEGARQYFEAKHQNSKTINKAILGFITNYYNQPVQRGNKSYEAISKILGEDVAQNTEVLISSLKEELKNLLTQGKKRKSKRIKTFLSELGEKV